MFVYMLMCDGFEESEAVDSGVAEDERVAQLKRETVVGIADVAVRGECAVVVAS